MADLPEDRREELIKTEFDRLRGRMLGLVESFGLPERQEKACKSTIKALSYDSQKAVTDLLNES